MPKWSYIKERCAGSTVSLILMDGPFIVPPIWFLTKVFCTSYMYWSESTGYYCKNV